MNKFFSPDTWKYCKIFEKYEIALLSRTSKVLILLSITLLGPNINTMQHYIRIWPTKFVILHACKESKYFRVVSEC